MVVDSGLKSIENSTEYCWEITRVLTEDCFPRLTGTDGNRKAAVTIEKQFDQYCDQVETQEFIHRPTGFLKFLPFSGIIHVIGLLLFLLGSYLVSVLLFTLNAFIFISQLLFYWGLFDLPFKKEVGKNIIGYIEPKEEVKQQIILSGHYDAPYVFQLIERFPKLYSKIFGIGLGSVILGFLGSMVVLLLDLNNDFNSTSIVFVLYTVLLIITSIPVLSFFFFTTTQVSPGAGDNAIALGLISSVGRELSKSKLVNTRIIVLALDAEEAGLNGARAYVNKYKKDLHRLPTYNFNIDSIYHRKFLQIFTRDLNSIRKLSLKEAIKVQQISENLGFKIPLGKMPVGGGSTDSAEFSRIGIDSIALVGIDLETIGQKTSYHSSRDDMSALSKESVSFIIEMMIEYSQQKDNSISAL